MVLFDEETIPGYLKRYVFKYILNFNSFHLKLFRYWRQRYKISSKFDEGLWLNEVSWYSITPERVAKCVFYLLLRNSVF